jgi:hypothetical protein
MCEARFALSSTAKPGAISPTPASRQGRSLPLVGGNSVILYAGCSALSFDDHLNSVPSIHIRCRMTASLRATATLALPIAWWIGRCVARATAALAVLVAGMALALALEVRIYWNVFPLRVGSDLAVIAVPIFQLFFLVIIVLFAWLTGRWISWRSTRPPAADH